MRLKVKIVLNSSYNDVPDSCNVLVNRRDEVEQIAFTLRQAESGTSVAEITPRTLEEENSKHNQVVADLSLNKKRLQDVLSEKL